MNKDTNEAIASLIVLYFLVLSGAWFSFRAFFYKALVGGVVVIALFFGIRFLWRGRKRKQRKSYLGRDEAEQYLRSLKGVEFSEKIAELFQEKGYKAKVKDGPGDQGIDIVLHKDGKEHYVQCKSYEGAIPAKDIREFYGVYKQKLQRTKAFFVANSIFTSEAKDFAKNIPIELFGINKLLEYFYDF